MSTPRQQARDSKLPTYSRGKPCKHGHEDVRYTSTGSCVECTRVFNSRYRCEQRSDIITHPAFKIHRDDLEAVKQFIETLVTDRYGVAAPGHVLHNSACEYLVKHIPNGTDADYAEFAVTHLSSPIPIDEILKGVAALRAAGTLRLTFIEKIREQLL